MKAKINKTNAVRLLDKAKIDYELIPYEVDENDLAAAHGITGVAHQGAHQGGFTGTVVAHQNMGLTGINGQVQTVQKHFLLLAYGNLQIFDFQQGTAHGIHLQMISGTARLGIESRVMR